MQIRPLSGISCYPLTRSCFNQEKYIRQFFKDEDTLFFLQFLILLLVLARRSYEPWIDALTMYLSRRLLFLLLQLSD